MKKQVKTILLLTLIAPALGRAGEQSAPLADFENQRDAIQQKWGEQEQRFTGQYVAALNHLQKKYQQAADLDAIVEIQSERKRFEHQQSLNSSNLSQKNRYLTQLQSKALAAWSRIQTTKQDELSTHKKAYREQLNAEMVALTKAGKLQEALLIRSQLKRSESPQAVSRATILDRRMQRARSKPSSPEKNQSEMISASRRTVR